MIGDTSFKLFLSGFPPLSSVSSPVVAREKSKWGQVDQEDLRDGAVLLPDRVFPVAFVTSLVLGKFIRDCFGGPMGPPGPPGPPGFGPPPP
ncbi:hypothetical protein Godav_028188 [Gossypium davidsonii]|uniref:Uncharacterized protein n=1 Tax=Gossypium davidsonii TaxID=34287 RepID=A0A7J8S018_GOSDV|nr:hypothetical protein [Gossypium davidsonii]